MGHPDGGPWTEGQHSGIVFGHVRGIPQAVVRVCWRTEPVRRIRHHANPEDEVQAALKSPESDGSSHLLMLLELSPTSRSSCQKRIASRHMFEMFWDRHMKCQVSKMLFFYDLFQDTPLLSAAASWIFELRIHQLLWRGNLVNLFQWGKYRDR